MADYDLDRPEGGRPVPKERGFEPYELNRPIPRAVLAVALALGAWGAITLWLEDGGDAPAPARPAAVEGEAAAPGHDGEALFLANCATCHKPNGSGIYGAVPPLAGSRYVTGDPEVPIQLVLHGVEGPIAVGGRVFDGHMPVFGDVLGDGEIAAIVSHLRTSWGHDAGPVSAERVAAARARFAADRGPWRGGREIEAVLGVPAGITTAADAPEPDATDKEDTRG